MLSVPQGDPSLCCQFRREIRLSLCSHFYGEMGLFAMGFFAVSTAPVLGDRPEAEQVETSIGVAMGAVRNTRRH